MARIIEYIKIALMNIRGNKARSFLTMLGIIIGISSVILIVSAGNGFKVGISGQLDALVGGFIQIYADVPANEADAIMFNDDDIDAIYEKVPHVKGATDIWQMGANGSAQTTKGTFSVAPTFGNESLQFYNSSPILKGRYFNKVESQSGAKVCVINERGAKKLFGTTDVVGLELSMSMWGITEDYTIVGIKKDDDSLAKQMTMGSYGDVSMEIPITLLEELYGYYTEEFSSFIVFADSSEYVTDISKQVQSLLEARYNVRGKDYIQSMDMASQVGMISDILKLCHNLYYACGRDSVDRRRNRRHEYYAGIGDRADERNWHSKGARRKDRLNIVSVFDGGGDHYADWRICRNCAWRLGRKGDMRAGIKHGNGQYGSRH